MSQSKEKRINILSQNEIDELYERPSFSLADREDSFSLDSHILEIIADMRKVETKIYFILLLGYFRSKPVVPKFDIGDITEDIEHIRDTYFPKTTPSFDKLAKGTRSNLVSKMLEVLGFERLTKSKQDALADRLKDVATICADPRY
ncbi:MAG: DUF4158 domain-containing protein [Endozoicomonas sp.]|uniref:DUF4158 domain-containing protein n=1 Tax=Endozoicomonas sp. TaxID=1892382 RepID=UPI003D9BD3FD